MDPLPVRWKLVPAPGRGDFVPEAAPGRSDFVPEAVPSPKEKWKKKRGRKKKKVKVEEKKTVLKFKDKKEHKAITFRGITYEPIKKEKCERSFDDCSVDCEKYHPMPASMKDEYNYLMGKIYKDELFHYERDLPRRFNENPWFHCMAIAGNGVKYLSYDQWLDEAGDQKTYRVVETGCLRCGDGRVTIMALKDDGKDQWARYYCCLPHMMMVEDSDCKWYPQEPYVDGEN